jgi:hypothetical protein
MVGGDLPGGDETMARFVKVARLEDLPAGTGTIAVGPSTNPWRSSTWAGRSSPPTRFARIGGGPLATGRLDGHVVACPWHGWTFDVRTGQPDHPGRHCVAAYEVKVEHGDVYVGWIKP